MWSRKIWFRPRIVRKTNVSHLKKKKKNHTRPLKFKNSQCGLFSFAIDASFSPLLVDYDSLNAIQLLLKEETCYAAEWVLVEEIRRLLVSTPSYSIRFAPRTTNGVADRLGLPTHHLGLKIVCVRIILIFLTFDSLVISDICGTFFSDILSLWVFLREVLTRPSYNDLIIY
ncbi:hypothetical protein PRUPE_6G191300 [Prunus persica]|uniref:RNase H type-1 domain-containing protein n=1 Tax=Prunus persica TaxID=3760 RepID=A0A251NSN3_PRUPE|nr:hypothetical protein PRUPE_6G191300 [Prunus persica]